VTLGLGDEEQERKEFEIKGKNKEPEFQKNNCKRIERGANRVRDKDSSKVYEHLEQKRETYLQQKRKDGVKDSIYDAYSLTIFLFRKV
jgi:hypothetical protein